ncbi:unnamed protein product [Amoebophrya sp. A25]|nr:unnamed protein product [Amoebophrya sp. A25]|eukprot:GSA25T00014068001.1
MLWLTRFLGRPADRGSLAFLMLVVDSEVSGARLAALDASPCSDPDLAEEATSSAGRVAGLGKRSSSSMDHIMPGRPLAAPKRTTSSCYTTEISVFTSDEAFANNVKGEPSGGARPGEEIVRRGTKGRSRRSESTSSSSGDKNIVASTKESEGDAGVSPSSLNGITIEFSDTVPSSSPSTTTCFTRDPDSPAFSGKAEHEPISSGSMDNTMPTWMRSQIENIRKLGLDAIDETSSTACTEQQDDPDQHWLLVIDRALSGRRKHCPAWMRSQRRNNRRILRTSTSSESENVPPDGVGGDSGGNRPFFIPESFSSDSEPECDDAEIVNDTTSNKASSKDVFSAYTAQLRSCGTGTRASTTPSTTAGLCKNSTSNPPIFAGTSVCGGCAASEDGISSSTEKKFQKNDCGDHLNLSTASTAASEAGALPLQPPEDPTSSSSETAATVDEQQELQPAFTTSKINEGPRGAPALEGGVLNIQYCLGLGKSEHDDEAVVGTAPAPRSHATRGRQPSQPRKVGGNSRRRRYEVRGEGPLQGSSDFRSSTFSSAFSSSSGAPSFCDGLQPSSRSTHIAGLSREASFVSAPEDDASALKGTSFLSVTTESYATAQDLQHEHAPFVLSTPRSSTAPSDPQSLTIGGRSTTSSPTSPRLVLPSTSCSTQRTTSSLLPTTTSATSSCSTEVTGEKRMRYVHTVIDVGAGILGRWRIPSIAALYNQEVPPVVVAPNPAGVRIHDYADAETSTSSQQM